MAVSVNGDHRPADSAVTTAKIADGSVTAAKLNAFTATAPSSPVNSGSAGSSSSVARADHRHPPGWLVQAAGTALPDASLYPDGFVILVY